MSDRGVCLEGGGGGGHPQVNEAYCCQIILTTIYQLPTFFLFNWGWGIHIGKSVEILRWPLTV
jgi:hypothetical protein